MNRLNRWNNIYQIGPDISAKGGISTLIRVYIKEYGQKYGFKTIPTYTSKGMINKLILYTRALLQVIWLSIFSKNCLFHIHITKGGSCLRKLILATILLIAHKPYILHIHGSEFLPFITDRRLRLRRYIIYLFNHSWRIVTIAGCWGEEYRKLFNPEKIIIIPNPCPIIIKEVKERDNEIPVLLYTGRLNRAKGVYDLIDATREIAQENKVCLKLFGDGELEQVREHVGGTENISVFPWAEKKRIIYEYDHADIFILPSYGEGLPMSILEAMGRGLPIIATRVGGIPEIVIENYNGFLLEAGDIERLCALITVLINDKEQRKTMGLKSNEHASKYYSLSVVETLLEELYGGSN